MKNKFLLLVFISAILFAVSPISSNMYANDEPKENTSLLVTLTDSNYKKETSKGLVLVDFWASWCGPCRKLAPVLEELAKEHKDIVKIGKVNVDNYKKFAIDLGIEVLPTIVVYKEGKEVTRLKGVVSKEKLVEVIKAYSAKKD